MKIPVNKKWLKLITEICKDALKKPVNNEGKNHVCLYNYFTLYMSINKHIHLSKKSWMICFKTFVFATQSFMLPKVMVTTKDR